MIKGKKNTTRNNIIIISYSETNFITTTYNKLVFKSNVIFLTQIQWEIASFLQNEAEAHPGFILKTKKSSRSSANVIYGV